MMCMNLYVQAVGGRTDPEEQGFVMMNALSYALERDADELTEALEPLMASPDDAFSLGAEHANTAYEKIAQGDHRAFEEFNENIRSKYLG